MTPSSNQISSDAEDTQAAPDSGAVPRQESTTDSPDRAERRDEPQPDREPAEGRPGAGSEKGAGESVGTRPPVWRRMLLPWNLFTLLALVFGVVYIGLTPPGYNADEPHQFFRALQVAEGEMVGYPIDHDDLSDMVARGSEKVGGEVPASAGLLIRESRIYPIEGRLGGPDRVGAIDWRAMFSIPTNATVNGQPTLTIGMSNVEVYSPLVYVPTIVPYYVGKVLNLPIAVVFYLARLVNLVTAVLITRVAIKRLPRGKWVFALLAVMPTTIVQYGAVSADPLTISMAFLCIALTLRAALQSTAVTARQWGVMAAAFIVLGLAKPTYIVLLGLLVAIPVCNPRARGGGAWLAWGAVALTGGVCALAWQHSVDWVPPSFQSIEKVHAQSAFVIDHPLRFLRTLIYTFFTDWGDTRFFLTSFVGSASWNGIPLATLLTYSMFGALALAPLARERSELEWEGTAAQRRVLAGGMLVLFTTACVALAFGLYIMWTPAEGKVVTGMQGRYFIPIAPLFFLALIPFKARAADIQVWLRRMMVTVAVACLIEMAVQIWAYEWTAISLLQ